MKSLHTFEVKPLIPEKIKRLKELAYNLCWTWDIDTIFLFRRLNRELWEEVGHNPIKLLGKIKQSELEKAAENEGFLFHYERVCQKFDNYLKRTPWYEKQRFPKDNIIAYFSTEFGITECLPFYSGGLGILAADHLKSASDLGLPIIGVSLLYQQGYFRQYLNVEGWQQEEYLENDFYTMPIQRVYNEKGEPIIVEVEYPGRIVKADIWKAIIGRITLYFLNTNLEENNEEDRKITSQLYGGDIETRIQQEIMLGIGGVRALRLLGIRPTVYHMNEGHSAFLGLENIRVLIEEENLSFEEALEVARSQHVFTTHTPVPAGIDRFPFELIEKYFKNYCPKLKIDLNRFFELGYHEKDSKSFCMAILALRLAGYYNAVSKLHGKTSRRMWNFLWPNVPEEEIPIIHITNGVHARTWISYPMANLFERYLGLRWVETPEDHSVWKSIDSIPDEELWRIHENRRANLVTHVREKLKRQLKRRNVSPKDIEIAGEVLNPDILTIGFARRFVEYKRANLIFQDPKRLSKIINNPNKPVQIIIAGKAHPKDEIGKKIITQIIHLARKEEFRNKVVFLEDYNMEIARYLVQGVDVWLNTPRRPKEASGTSGMKATANGALNLSILDGWWVEAYKIGVGWAIGAGEEYPETEEGLKLQDKIESNALYDILEKEVVPLFYDRDKNDIPRGWIKMMKQAMKKICPFFNTTRMVQEYTEKIYIPAYKKFIELKRDNYQGAIELAYFRKHLTENWGYIQQIENIKIHSSKNGNFLVGDEIIVEAFLCLGNIKPNEIIVEVYYGNLNARREITNPRTIRMKVIEKIEKDANKNCCKFKASIPCKESGIYGFAIRILPQHKNLPTPYHLGLIKWL